MLFLEALVESVRAQLAAAQLCGGAVTKNADTPTKDEKLPRADVFVAADDFRPDGDARTGYPTFVHTSKLVVEITDKGNGGPALKAKLCAHADQALAILLCDLRWWGSIVEGVGGGAQTYNQPPEGLHTTGAVQLQLDVLWRSAWPPPTASLPNFNTASVDAGNGIGATFPASPPN